MITLYDAPRCPFCARVRIVLAEKAIPHETIVVDLDDRPSWIVDLNPPAGRVPVLDDQGWVLPESVVVNEYLEERFPDPPLLPDDPGERAAARLLIFRFTDLERPYYALRRGDGTAAPALGEALATLNLMLEAVPHLTGRRFGLADVAYLPWVIRARDMLDVDLGPTPALEAWLDRVATRPAVAAEIELVAALAA
jgi:glutathione S-transferase